MMASFYSERLSAERLRRCYEIAPPRVKQYFEAEIAFVASRVCATDTVLELGCGYGRIVKELATKAKAVVGIDSSQSSLQLARQWLGEVSNCQFIHMDAAALGFGDRTFDVVVCVQNGLSAFHVDPHAVIRESIRVTRPGGRVLLSSYSPRFWEHRLEWFQLQAGHGLLGEIDQQATRDGVIVCKDGFHASTVSPDQFLALTAGLDVQSRTVTEVDESSIFCELVV